ncbi:MAG: bifunctional hydroxymethylpyrimidine kinase/phosphomethylpyrimidine kinase [Clostridium sp.]|nr:MAG: bifunctional hydroxymethylpyrimidine kinase/phosphomethylpyrimidine kinase [Clostridium sp.]
MAGFYSGFEDDFINKNKTINKKRTKVITPNLTEARFITKKENIDDIFKEFKKLGANIVVITGIEENDKIGVICEYNNIRFNYFHEKIVGKFYGTGDMFKSVLFFFAISK